MKVLLTRHSWSAGREANGTADLLSNMAMDGSGWEGLRDSVVRLQPLSCAWTGSPGSVNDGDGVQMMAFTLPGVEVYHMALTLRAYYWVSCPVWKLG